MDYRKTNAPSNTVTRDMMKLSSDTGQMCMKLLQSLVNVLIRFLLR